MDVLASSTPTAVTRTQRSSKVRKNPKLQNQEKHRDDIRIRTIRRHDPKDAKSKDLQCRRDQARESLGRAVGPPLLY